MIRLLLTVLLLSTGFKTFTVDGAMVQEYTIDSLSLQDHEDEQEKTGKKNNKNDDKDKLTFFYYFKYLLFHISKKPSSASGPIKPNFRFIDQPNTPPPDSH